MTAATGNTTHTASAQIFTILGDDGSETFVADSLGDLLARRYRVTSVAQLAQKLAPALEDGGWIVIRAEDGTELVSIRSGW